MTADDYTFITLRGERVYGSTAAVTGRSNQKGQENGKHYSGDYRFTRVYSKQNGRWQTVALQTTLIQP